MTVAPKDQFLQMQNQAVIRRHTAKTVARFMVRVISPYEQYDSSEYWRSRAKMPGEARAFWKNQHYSTLARKEQMDSLRPFMIELKEDPSIFGVGCGVDNCFASFRSCGTRYAPFSRSWEQSLYPSRVLKPLEWQHCGMIQVKIKPTAERS
jgi:hypothetical protein